MTASPKAPTRRTRKPYTKDSLFFGDFETTISNPWDHDEIELVFDDAARATFRRAAQFAVSIIVDDDAVPLEGYLPKRKGDVPWLASLNVPLGRVTGARETLRGQRDDFGTTDVDLHIEPIDSESAIRVETGTRATLPRYWCGTLSEAFVAIVESLCDGSYPPALPELRTTVPDGSAAALIREGWGEGGDEAYCPGVDHWWNRVDLDVERLLAAIERTKSPDSTSAERWDFVRATDGSLRLLCPLMTETFRVEFSHLPEPRFVGSRYWLAMDVSASGRLEDVTLRRDRDPTYDAEADTPRESLLSDRLSENAYGLVTSVMEDFQRNEDVEDE